MAGTKSFVNLSFPGNVSSQPAPPVGTRAELFIHRGSGTTHHYNWTVPAGVTFIKATIAGAGGETNTGGTTTLGQYATATGGSAVVNGNIRGVFSVSTTKFPQNVGVNFSTASLFFEYGLRDSTAGGGDGGCGVIFLENMIPGTNIRIVVGRAGGGGSTGGVVVLEY
jgi:hypothetical protein